MVNTTNMFAWVGAGTEWFAKLGTHGTPPIISICTVEKTAKIKSPVVLTKSY